MNIRTSHPPNHATISATTPLKKSTYSTKITTGPLSSHSHHTSGLPKETTGFISPTHEPTKSRSDTTSSPSGTAVAPYSSTTITKHPSSHTSTPPKTATNTTHNTLMTEHMKIPNTAQPHQRPSTASSSYDGVPGWGIALLVLASVILLLLIIFFILALWRWCCRQEETGPTNMTGDPSPYEKLNVEPSAPEFQSKDPNGKIYPEDFEKPKKNRTGMYVVNP
ncbi:salivary glue protein Sgs-3-like [Brienomyrus brachyistius]|uniref:salivary glue protein Sgs-3-like n=1 Tax=Brienomyrus brachyistius TaxID=42636 RepID=UPI0020B1E8DD|nr:salivary glue protein Sgs-3-like [Brienomyrus brachyistius]